MASRIARNFIRLTLSLLLVLFLFGFNVLLALSNYLGCKISFELLGTENRPLGTDELVGVYFRSFFGQASLAHLYAMLVAGTVSVGLFLVLKLAFDTLKLVEDQRLYRENGDQQSAQIAMRRIVYNLIMIAIFAVPLGFAIYWDIHLFRFRSIAQVMGYEYPEKVVTLVNWSEQLRQKPDMWVWFLTKIGAWGYLAITAICCLGLEYAIYRTGEQWALLLDALSELFRAEEAQAVGYDQHIQPVQRPNNPVPQEPERVPVFEQNVAGVGPDNSSGRPENVGSSERVAADVSLRPAISVTPHEVTDGRNGTGGGITATQFAVRNAGGNNGSGQMNPPGEALFDPGPAIPMPGEIVHSQAPGRRENEIALQPVIGSPKGERVSLAEALANPERYWVDSDSHEIWNVNYRGTLMG